MLKGSLNCSINFFVFAFTFVSFVSEAARHFTKHPLPPYGEVMPAVPIEKSRPTQWGNGQPRRKPAMTQILELQSQLQKDALDPGTSPAVRAQIARAWCDLQEERRKLQMRPLPKPIDTEALKRRKEKKASSSGLSE
jgi:hypothetical protein